MNTVTDLDSWHFFNNLLHSVEAAGERLCSSWLVGTHASPCLSPVLLSTLSHFCFSQPLSFFFLCLVSCSLTNALVLSVSDGSGHSGLIYRAFSIIETLESAWAKENQRTPVPLSPQQILSCEYDVSKGLAGCAGGNLYSAFSVINVSLWLQVSCVCTLACKCFHLHNIKWCLWSCFH